MLDIDDRQREILRLIWQEGRISRWELHQQMHVNPNAIGTDVTGLIGEGILRECASESAGPGRPRIPLEIDPSVRHVVGVALSPGRAEVGRLSLRGHLLGKPAVRDRVEPGKIVSTAQGLLRECINESTVSVGLSVTGFVDPIHRKILLSSSVTAKKTTSLEPLYETAGDCPVILENNMHALAAWWLLLHRAARDEDVLLVYIRDGQIGAALLVDGRPNRGCIIGANELGHTRFVIETDVCYCGHQGCLEQIFCTSFLRRRGVTTDTLTDQASRFTFNGSGNGSPNDKAMLEVLEYLSHGLANTVNLTRPNRLVLVSPYMRFPGFSDFLLRSVRSRLLAELTQLVHIDVWDQVDGHSAEAAGWLGLASLYHDGWNRRFSEPLAVRQLE